jgi:hypothetical protein
MRRPGENLSQQRLEAGERLPPIVGIERTLIPIRAKILARLVPGMVTKLVAPIAVTAQVMGIVIALE